MKVMFDAMALAAVLPAAGTDPHRPYLHGFRLEPEPNSPTTLNVVASNGHLGSVWKTEAYIEGGSLPFTSLQVVMHPARSAAVAIKRAVTGNRRKPAWTEDCVRATEHEPWKKGKFLAILDVTDTTRSTLSIALCVETPSSHMPVAYHILPKHVFPVDMSDGSDFRLIDRLPFPKEDTGEGRVNPTLVAQLFSGMDVFEWALTPVSLTRNRHVWEFSMLHLPWRGVVATTGG